MRIPILSIGATLALTACAAIPGLAPRQADPVPTPPDTVTFVDAPFDQVWPALVQAAQARFTIRNADPGRGVLTVALPAHPQGTIDCGRIGIQDALDVLNKDGAATFTGRMSLIARPSGEQRTRIIVNAAYVYRAIGAGYAAVWSFGSGETKTRRAGPRRTITCRPTYAAERAILTDTAALLAQASATAPPQPQAAPEIPATVAGAPEPPAASAQAAATETEPLATTPPDAPQPPARFASLPPTGVAVPTPTWFVQVAAVADGPDSEARARQAWRDIRARREALLAQENVLLRRAPTAGGAVWRILVGPFSERAAAATLCGALTQSGQDCQLRIGPNSAR